MPEPRENRGVSPETSRGALLEVSDLTTEFFTGDGVVHEVDMRNDGTLAGLADDDVVEVPARVEDGRLVPLPQEPLAPELLGLTQHVAAYERLAATAAVTKDIATARKALLAHPLIGQHPLNEELVESLLAAEWQRLPQPGREAIA